MSNLPPTSRTAFLDRLRSILTILVILHHTAIMYGAEGGWYLRYPADGLVSKLLLTLFCSVNQAFFMGMFFLLAGYFTTLSYEKKSALPFLRERLLRLGLPILLFGLVLGPYTIALAEAPADTSILSFWWHWVRQFHFNIGPLWFAYALLLFSLAYALLRYLLPSLRWQLTERALRHRWILFGIAIWAMGAFALRLWVPTGQEKALLQLGYFSSYILLFVLGCAAAKNRLLELIEGRLALPWLLITTLSLPVLFLVAIASGALRGVPFPVNGGWNLAALTYAVWEPFVAAGIILTLLWRSRVSAQPWRFWSRLAPLSYTSFIVHAPVVVALGKLLHPWQQPSLLMFSLVGSVSVVLSFGLAALIKKLPGSQGWL